MSMSFYEPFSSLIGQYAVMKGNGTEGERSRLATVVPHTKETVALQFDYLGRQEKRSKPNKQAPKRRGGMRDDLQGFLRPLAKRPRSHDQATFSPRWSAGGYSVEQSAGRNIRGDKTEDEPAGGRCSDFYRNRWAGEEPSTPTTHPNLTAALAIPTQTTRRAPDGHLCLARNSNPSQRHDTLREHLRADSQAHQNQNEMGPEGRSKVGIARMQAGDRRAKTRSRSRSRNWQCRIFEAESPDRQQHEPPSGFADEPPGFDLTQQEPTACTWRTSSGFGRGNGHSRATDQRTSGDAHWQRVDGL
ncbi:hypothetical protein DM02DRAFT_665410 [Periconia macrospinosa]|uniref:Uncharacterized protein n=1 Tax=Periconia macrospinosa TaxID=97972 RepID=A0A2V1CWT0_9PLEO|nr:hypothetical protein DM02DRAFT_665410 [Periconia macrospinosa]